MQEQEKTMLQTIAIWLAIAMVTFVHLRLSLPEEPFLYAACVAYAGNVQKMGSERPAQEMQEALRRAELPDDEIALQVEVVNVRKPVRLTARISGRDGQGFSRQVVYDIDEDQRLELSLANTREWQDQKPYLVTLYLGGKKVHEFRVTALSAAVAAATPLRMAGVKAGS